MSVRATRQRTIRPDDRPATQVDVTEQRQVLIAFAAGVIPTGLQASAQTPIAGSGAVIYTALRLLQLVSGKEGPMWRL